MQTRKPLINPSWYLQLTITWSFMNQFPCFRIGFQIRFKHTSYSALYKHSLASLQCARSIAVEFAKSSTNKKQGSGKAYTWTIFVKQINITRLSILMFDEQDKGKIIWWIKIPRSYTERWHSYSEKDLYLLKLCWKKTLNLIPMAELCNFQAS